MLKKAIASLIIFTILFSCSAKKEKADLIIHNALIYSVDSSFTLYEAMAIKDGKILELNTTEQILKKYEAAETNDAQGKAVFPGFIDAHCHFLGYGLGLQKIDLSGTKSFEEVIQRVKDFSVKTDEAENPKLKNETEWIVGRGWDQNDWELKEYPDNKKLDSLFPNTPVLLKRIDGHAALVNSEALKRAGINEKTKISGGELLMKNGKLTGVLIDNAVDLVSSKIPAASKEKMQQALLAAQKNCFEVGLTTVDDAGIMKYEVDVMDELQKSNQLKMRIYAMLSDSAPNYKYYLEKGPYKTDHLNVRSFKFYADGALGSRGACLLQNYSDKKDWKGFLLNSPKHFEQSAKLMYQKSFQMNTHCIGDSATRLMFYIYATAPRVAFDTDGKIFKAVMKEMRWRIEHAQVVYNKDVEYFKYIIHKI